MSFTNLYFVFLFIPALWVLHRLVPQKARAFVIVIASLVFYTLCTKNTMPYAVVWLFVSANINWIITILIRRLQKTKHIWLILGVLGNAGILVGCKWFSFLPLGVSFYTFCAISLLVDIYRTNESVGYLKTLEYLLMFPKLIMGPIARLVDVQEKKEPCLELLEEGLRKFTIGLAMKVLLADQLATLWHAICVSGASGLATETAWLGALTYTLELYLDFWGYTLMAIGLGNMFGYQLPQNFKDPYTSKTVGEFWRRWHITLGTWFRDYIYIPLGGSRKGKLRMFANLLVVWVLTGLWHGNGWNYLIWAGVLFALICLERFTPFGRIENTKVLCHIYIPVVMFVSWVIFAITDLSALVVYLKCMVGIHANLSLVATRQFERYLLNYWPYLVAGVLLLTPYPRRAYEKIRGKWWTSLPLLVLFWLSIYFLYKSGSNPFLYNQF